MMKPDNNLTNQPSKRRDAVLDRFDILDSATIMHDLDNGRFRTIELDKKILARGGKNIIVAFLFNIVSSKTGIVYKSRNIALCNFQFDGKKFRFKNRINLDSDNTIRNFLRIVARWHPKEGPLDAQYDYEAKQMEQAYLDLGFEYKTKD